MFPNGAGLSRDTVNPNYSGSLPPYGAANYCIDAAIQFYQADLTPIGHNIRLTSHTWDPQLSGPHAGTASNIRQHVRRWLDPKPLSTTGGGQRADPETVAERLRGTGEAKRGSKLADSSICKGRNKPMRHLHASRGQAGAPSVEIKEGRT